MIAYVFGKPSPKVSKALLGALILVFLAHTAVLGLRWHESYDVRMGQPPLSNLYESLVFFAWAVALALMVVRIRFGADLVVLLGLPLVFLMMASTFLLDPSIRPLIPALQSNWLMAHVISCFLGYAGFAVSFCAALLFLIAKASDSAAKAFPDTKVLDEIVYRSVLVGLPMLTIGIVTGAAWADYAWGSYWTWDPKETWSLITWLVYSAFVHTRLARGWSGRRTALLSVLGFLAVLVTFFGVNYLPGLHSYF